MASRSRRETTCPLCAAAAARHLVTKRGYDVVRCTSCGLVFVWPRPTQGELAALYSAGDYHAEVNEAERRHAFARRLRQIERLAPRRGRILDVGCSKGYFLEAARASGWDAVGIELNEKAASEARAKGLDVRHGDLVGGASLPRVAEFDAGSFDVVTLFDVLEHTGEPRAMLAACRRLLRPSGLLVVTTPDIGGLLPRLTYALFGWTLGAWDHPTPPGHLVQFSRRTLRRALEGAGFETVRERSEHIPVAYSAGKLENSIMDVLAGRHRAKPAPRAPGKARENATAAGARGSLLHRMPRLCVRLASWLVVGVGSLVAHVLGWGDSRWLAARKANDEALDSDGSSLLPSTPNTQHR